MSLVNSYIVAVDFDGTLVENGWPHMGPDIPGGPEALRAFLDAGIKVIIWTCRTIRDFPEGSGNGGVLKVLGWLFEHGFGAEINDTILINDNFLEVREAFSHCESRKVYANCYIDDRNAGGFIGWDAARQYVMADHGRFMAEVKQRTNASADS